MADDYELQNITTYRLRELLQHEKDNRALRTVNAELLAALKRAVDTIHAWHDMPSGGLSEADKATAWRIYNTHAPEMQAINAAIAKAEGR